MQLFPKKEQLLGLHTGDFTHYGLSLNEYQFLVQSQEESSVSLSANHQAQNTSK